MSNPSSVFIVCSVLRQAADAQISNPQPSWWKKEIIMAQARAEAEKIQRGK